MRNNQRIFIVLFTFFTVVALGSLIILNTSGSVFNRNRNSLGAKPAVLDNSTIIASDSSSEAVSEVPEPVAEASVEATTEEVPVVEEAPVEEASTEEISVEETPVEETPVVEETPAEETPAEEEIKYYKFTVSTKSTALNVRKEASMTSQILFKIPQTTPGYILIPGSEWSYIRTEDGITGYCHNDYLVVTKVTAEDFPEDIRGSVEAPTEELPADIFGE